MKNELNHPNPFVALRVISVSSVVNIKNPMVEVYTLSVKAKQKRKE